jgi:hypothetical protein
MVLCEWETEKVEMQEVGMELESGVRELEMEKFSLPEVKMKTGKKLSMEIFQLEAEVVIELERVSFCQLEIE